MASIKISELRPAGSELFQDAESFLNELTDSHDMANVLGGYSVNFNTAIFTYNNNSLGNSVNANTFFNENSVYTIVIIKK